MMEYKYSSPSRCELNMKINMYLHIRSLSYLPLWPTRALQARVIGSHERMTRRF
jgi:hypothetical protein